MTEVSNDPHVLSEGMPPSILLDPLSGPIDTSFLDPIGTVVLLVVGRVDRSWASASAMELSASWARGGRRIVLADLHLDDPVLEEELAGGPMEGMVDLFLYGASLSRIARPVRDGEFYVVTAGTYASDTAEIYGHPRWRKLVAGFRESSAALLLLVPADAEGLELLAGLASTAFLLGHPGDATTIERLRGAGLATVALMEPPPVNSLEGAPFPLEIGVAPIKERESSETLQAASELARTDIELELPPPPVRSRRPARSATLFVWFLVLVTVLVVAGYLVGRLRPELIPPGWLPTRPASEAEGASSAPAPAVTRVGESLPYSVQVRAFTSLIAAGDDLAQEQRRLPGVAFFISPEEIQGILYYRILAGTTSDTLSATRLRERLVQAGSIDPGDVVGAWSLLHHGPLAYDLGEFPDRQAVLARADTLLALRIPTYRASIPYSDGSRHWQLYGGAYGDSTSARRMGEMIAAAGLPPRLVERIGDPAGE